MAIYKKGFQKVDFILLHHLCDAAYLLQEVQKKFRLIPRDMATLNMLARSDERVRSEALKTEPLQPVRTGTDLRDKMRGLIQRGFVEEIREQPGQPKTMRAWRLTKRGFTLVEKINKFCLELQAERIK